MDSFESLIESSAAAHGHLCPGQVVGVRMAMLGCKLIGLDEPTRREQIKKLIVYVEMDRCTADAIAHVTGGRGDAGSAGSGHSRDLRPGE